MTKPFDFERAIREIFLPKGDPPLPTDYEKRIQAALAAMEKQ